MRRWLVQPRERSWMVFPPDGAGRGQLVAVGELLRRHRGEGPAIGGRPMLDLVVDGGAVPLPGQVTAAVGAVVEMLLAGCAVTCLPHPVDNPVDLRK